MSPPGAARNHVTMAVYDLLAPHYDAVTGDSATEAAFIHDIIERRHPQAATLLDLACGTGGLTALLAGAYQGPTHQHSLAAWQSTFDCACEHLNPGGLVVFDITTVSDLRQMASVPQIVQEFAGHYLVIRVRTTDGVVFDWHIEVYELQPDGRYRLLTQTVALRSFPLADIREALRANFASVEIISAGGSADNEDEDRIWFACRKAA